MESKKKSALIAFLILASYPKFVKSQQHMDKGGTMDYPTDSITKFAYYAEPKLVILSPTKITEYTVGKENWSVSVEKEHKIENLKTTYIKAKMDRSGKVFIAAGDYLRSFDANLNYQEVGEYTKNSFSDPVKENFKGFSKVMDFNDYQSYVALMTDNSYLYELKYFREKVISNQISPTPRVKTGRIVYMSYVKFGRRLAAFFEDKTLVLYRTTWPTYDEAIVSDYQFPIVPLNIGQCDEVDLFAVLMEKEVLFFDVTTIKLVKSYKFKDEDIKDNPLISCRSPSGTKILLIFSPKKIFFLDLTNLEMITIETLDVTNPAKWLYYLSGTDKFLTEEPIPGKEEATRYTAYEFTMKDSRFCHKTCGPKCKVNFQPCSIFNKLFKYLLWITGVIISSVVLFFVLSTARDSYRNRHKLDGHDGSTRGFNTTNFFIDVAEFKEAKKVGDIFDGDDGNTLDYDSDEKKDDEDLGLDNDEVAFGEYQRDRSVTEDVRASKGK